MMSRAVVAAQYRGLGVAHFERGEFRQAIAAFDSALALTPDDTYAKWNRATALLSTGDYKRGFQEHDVAWRLFNWKGFSTIGDVDRIKHLPIWRGEANAKVLAYHELGFGDAIMAFRFLPELIERAEVTLVIDQCLTRLARSFDIEVLAQLPDDLDYDFRLPFFGVMSALGIDSDTIPAAPYIIPVNGEFASGGKNIGIAWSGRTQTMFTLERFLSLFAYSGFELYSLQPGPLARDDVVELPPGSDFLDVAERIEEMDHIVSVDTAAIHLAGAMGHPSAHLLLPTLIDWRWHRTDLWYPALKTYRQCDAHDWSAPFARLNEAMHVGGV